MSNCTSSSRGNVSSKNSNRAVEQRQQQTITQQETFGYRYGIMNVSEGEDGEITVTKAQKRNTGNGSRSNPEYEYSVKGAYIDVGADSNEYRDNRDATVLHGVNINKVKSVSGDTYNLQTFLKQNRFKWNRDKKRWER